MATPVAATNVNDGAVPRIYPHGLAALAVTRLSSPVDTFYIQV